ncbi:MAG TPA: hypothetical protein EYH08_04150 [Pyrodictium sp.]|nr:hypothetical protein [Pyrodictium sp.]
MERRADMVYIGKTNAVKALLILLILLTIQPVVVEGLTFNNTNTTCNYTVKEVVSEDGVVVDVRIVANGKLPNPQTLRVRVIGDDGVVVVEVVKPLAKVHCSFEEDKLVLKVGDIQNVYRVTVLDDQTIAIRPSVGRAYAIDIDVEGGSVVDYALSSIKLVDALLYGYPVNLRGKLLAISCSSRHNVSIFQIFYRGTVRGWLDAHVQVKHNILLYSYRGPPLPSIEDLLDILKERCRGVIESRGDVRSRFKYSYIGVEEPLLPLPAGLATLLDNILPVPHTSISPMNKGGNSTHTIPEIVEAVKQAYKRLLDIVKSTNNTISEKQGVGVVEDVETHVESSPTTSTSTRQTNIDIPLLLFPLALAVVAYMVWREHRI